MDEKRLFLLDAYALIFRAYYALIKMPRLTRDGFNTSAIFGFVNTLEEVLRKEHPSHIAVCFDPAGPTFRSEAYADYKGERSSTPEDIKKSIPVIKEIIRAYNIPIILKEGFEADDVIGTMARRAEAEGFTVYMMTPDKDFGQLVSSNVLQYKPAYRGQDFELRGEQEVIRRYGLQSTRQVIDLLALMGDKIDNIPGCPGVGEKTAVKLIGDFGSVDNLIAHTDQLKGALKKKVEENAEQILFSKYLATIRTDVPLDIRPDDLVCRRPDTDKLFAIFKEMEFRTLAERVRKRMGMQTAAKAAPASLFDFTPDDNADTRNDAARKPSQATSLESLPHDFKAVADDATLEEMKRHTLDAKRIGIAILAPGDDDMSLRWEATAIAVEGGKCWVVAADYADAQAAVLDIFARHDLEKVTADAKATMICAARATAAPGRIPSVPSLSNYFDVTLAHYLLQADMRHGIDLIASSYLNHQMQPVPESAKAGRKNAPAPGILPAPIEISEESRCRLCEEALVCLMLRDPLEKEVKAIDAWPLLVDVEFPLARVLAKMEITGVRIDMQALRQAADEMEGRLTQIEKEIHDLAGTDFNVSSPAKVGEVLFEKMALDPKAKKTKTGQYSTSEAVLEKLLHKSPVVQKILDYRKLRKLLSTYLLALPGQLNHSTGRVHTNYNQTVTATGRISSSNPNLQNIPVREEMGREIRRAFIPSEGNLFLSADYSQIELRLVADFAGDRTMLDAFATGADIHAITAAKIYHKDVADVSADERRHAKTANFGILYGITPFGLSQRLNIPRSEAKDLIDNYFNTFPTIRKYMSDSVEQAREHGYALTRSGRRRYLPDILSANPTVRGYAERNAVNAPVQGSAADIIKRAMVAIDKEMTEKGMQSKMIMQVHDELNFDVVPEELPAMQELVERLMEEAYAGKVRLTATAGVATNWLDAH
ncbi:MAG: DNA polymerase I [Muribaculum sp.]|nr:DNA polymerase I [Muribaculum sp.]